MANTDLGKIAVVKNMADFTKPSGVVIGVSQPTSFILSKARLQRTYNWDVVLPDISSLFGKSTGILGSIGKVLEGIQGFAVSQFCQSVEFGDYSLNEISTIRYGAYQANFPGLFVADRVRMSFLKPMPDVVSMYFYAWKKLIMDADGLYNVKSKYQKTIYIRFLDSTGISIQRYKLTGCFPVSFPKYMLDYERSGVERVNIEFMVDKIEME